MSDVCDKLFLSRELPAGCFRAMQLLNNLCASLPCFCLLVHYSQIEQNVGFHNTCPRSGTRINSYRAFSEILNGTFPKFKFHWKFSTFFIVGIEILILTPTLIDLFLDFYAVYLSSFVENLLHDSGNI